MDRGSDGSRGHLTHRVQRFGVYATAIAATYLLLRPAAGTDESTRFGDFRGYFAFDQLSYAAIASTAAGGNFGFVEPFTETGTSYYPSLWYKTLGLLSLVTGIGIPGVWSIAGFFVVFSAVTAFGWITHKITGRLWTVLLVVPALWIGPLATVTTGWSWYVDLQSHAVLWGPYGMLFPLNAESVGIAFGLVAVCFALAANLQASSRRRLALIAMAGTLVGILANIQTYAFFFIVALFSTWAALLGIRKLNTRRALLIVGLSASWFVLVGIAANVVPQLRTSLLVFLLALGATVPGVLVFARRRPLIIIVGVGMVGLFALPQVALYASGVIAQSPFLSYRQVQSADLGVDAFSFILATLPVAAWALVIVMATQRSALPTGAKTLVPAAATTFVIMSFNNLWGFEQEPYRLWIVGLTVLSLCLVPATGFALSSKRSRNRLLGSPLLPTAALGLVLLSWWNIGGFRGYVSEAGSIPFASSRLTALTVLTENRGGLIASDPCIDPQQLKVTSRARVAFYNEGLAWPKNREAIEGVMEARESGELDPPAMRRAGVTFLVTDSNCSTAWDPGSTQEFVLADEVPYGASDSPASLRLWLLR